MPVRPSRPSRATRPLARAALPLALLVTAVAAPAAPAQTPRLVLELEGGPVWQGYNDAEIPNDGSATRFSLSELAGGGPFRAGRAYLTWNVAERHGVRALAAPFTLTETGTPTEAIRFAGASFAAGRPLEATYTFNSYRLTYRYRWHAAERSTAWVGFTAKLRDAVVRLEQDGVAGRKDDRGFVPLLHAAADWRVAPRWRVGLDADALAGGPGRAVDAAVKLGYDPGGPWMVQVGYRTLEGGADVPEVYSFAWLHYAVAAVVWRW